MANQHVSTLFNMARERFERELDQSLLSEWLCKNTRLKGKPFSLDRYPFQRALIDETHPNAVTIKPSQVGVSEIYQRIAMAMLARNPYRKGIYAYPSDDMKKKTCRRGSNPCTTARKLFIRTVQKPSPLLT